MQKEQANLNSAFRIPAHMVVLEMNALAANSFVNQSQVTVDVLLKF